MCEAHVTALPEAKVTDLLGDGAVATIHIRWDAVPALKEMALFADRTHPIGAVRELGWEIFEALDELTAKDIDLE